MKEVEESIGQRDWEAKYTLSQMLNLDDLLNVNTCRSRDKTVTVSVRLLLLQNITEF